MVIMDYQGDLTAEKVFEIFRDGIKSINYEISSGDSVVLDKGTIVDANDDGFYIQGGVTYDQTFWWGKKRYKSTVNARKWAVDMRSAGHANAAAGMIIAVFGGAPAGLVNGLTAIYCYNFADRVDYWNNKNNRGVVADITWLLVFNINNQ